MSISIIIPTYNEECCIAKTLNILKKRQSTQQLVREIIVVDAGSEDNTQHIVNKEFKHVKLVTSQKGRPQQMNIGAGQAKADILYFLHADSYPPQNYDVLIQKSVCKNAQAGCFRMKFDHSHPWMQFISWLTKFNARSCRGGDQSLFVTKNLFKTVGGYDETYKIFEDHEIIAQLYQHTRFRVIQNPLVSSARRFNEKGILKLQVLYWSIYFKKWLGADAHELFRFYKKYID